MRPWIHLPPNMAVPEQHAVLQPPHPVWDAPDKGMGETTHELIFSRTGLYGVTGLAMLVCGIHGWKRAGGDLEGLKELDLIPVMWGAGWAFLGYMSPLLAVALAISQGYAEPKKKAKAKSWFFPGLG